MKYIALLYGEPDAGPVPGTPEFMEMLGELQSATEAMADAGILVDSSPLQPPQTATTVRVRDGGTQLSDGPFAEIKEQLGGYYILECEDLDAALRCAAMIPSAKYGSVEVRPVLVLDVRPAAEYAAGHAAGAVSIPAGELPARLAGLPRDKEIVAYCRGRFCVMSLDAVRLLRRHGYRARPMDGGLPEWRDEGMPIAAA